MTAQTIEKTVTKDTTDRLVAEGWTFEKDSYGDWRGISPDGRQRTRLKATRAWAVYDATIGRLQTRQGRMWLDEIDGGRKVYTMPAEVPA